MVQQKGNVVTLQQGSEESRSKWTLPVLGLEQLREGLRGGSLVLHPVCPLLSRPQGSIFRVYHLLGEKEAPS